MVDGKAPLFTRNGISLVRLYKGKRQYNYKSLKTRDVAKARELAVRRTKTRPAFTLKEYSVLYKCIRRWMHEEKNNARWRYTRELLRDYVLILANSGMRVGEANNLSVGDLEKFTDERGRKNYAFNVNGKTGKRYVILRANARRYVERTLERNAHWQAEWKLTAELN